MRCLLIVALFFTHLFVEAQNFELPQLYVCHQSTGTIQVDGLGNEKDWQAAPWSNLFVDIEGSKKPNPYLDTRMKMLWDSSYLYFFAELKEPHLWAKLTKRDAVIFYDNDFEIFIDPDGDTHNYYEFEMNALNTVWDLLLTRPYRDHGRAIDHWNINGLKTAVKLNGTLNDPSDTDTGWTVEIAMPWDALKEAARMKTPPREADHWRINFSRVQWETEVVNGNYVKKKDPNTGKRLPENNWVWSPQRAIAMHEPEFWGIVHFTTAPPTESVKHSFDHRSEFQIHHLMYSMHRAQVAYFRKHKHYASNVNDLAVDFPPAGLKGLKIAQLQGHEHGYQLVLRDTKEQVNYYINETGQSRVFKR